MQLQVGRFFVHKHPVAASPWQEPEVMKLLGISPGPLQNMRINGTIPYTKVGGILYYDYHEIMGVLENNRVHNKL